MQRVDYVESTQGKNEGVPTLLPLLPDGLYARQVDLPLDYDGVHLDCGYRADIIVNNEIIPEVKSVEHVLPLHKAQLLTYLCLSRCRVGLLLNFNTLSLKDGVRRRVV